jgi:hypothetical protein
MNSTYCFIVNGNEVIEGDNLNQHTLLPMLTVGRNDAWYLARDEDYAISVEKSYWENMAWRDSNEFVCLIGGAEQVIDYWLRGETVDDVIGQIMAEHSEFGDIHYVDSMSEYIFKQYPDLDWEEVYQPDSDEPIEADLEYPDDENTIEVERVDDINAARALARGWWELCQDLGFEPEVAYRRD